MSDSAMDRLRAVAVELGVDERIASEAPDEPFLFGSIIDALLIGKGDRKFDDMAAASGLSRETAARAWLALGFADPTAIEAGAGEGEEELLRFVDLAHSMMGSRQAMRIAWVFGTSLSRVADTIVSAIQFSMEWPRSNEQTPRAELAKFYEQVTRDVVPMLSRSLETMIRRQLAARVPYDWPAAEPAVRPLAESAITAIRFTKIDEVRIGELLEDVPRAIDQVVGGVGGRFVRFDIDSAIVASPLPAPACECSRMITELPVVSQLEPAVGVAWGKVSSRHSNVFGPTVNTARRLAGLAAPGEILVTEELAAAVGSMASFSLEPTGAEVLRGIDGPTGVFRLV